jgi:heat shock protein HspQ
LIYQALQAPNRGRWYKVLAENEKLEARAKASEKGKMKDTMERAKLKSELDNLQRLVDRIPPDILAELKRQQRHTVKER